MIHPSSRRGRSDAPTAEQALERLRSLADPGSAAVLRRFFKTGPGQYGEGDSFLGIRVPAQRRLARELATMSVSQAGKLLRSEEHEARSVALMILSMQYARGDERARKAIYELYLASTRFINNWDLVDSSAAQIVGAHLFDGDKAPLTKLARSADLWERRIAIIATLHFIRQMQFAETLRIATLLLHDEHDLIHKAVGWMLREVGKRDLASEKRFLDVYASTMPRTMLRYAIERFPEDVRQSYLRTGKP